MLLTEKISRLVIQAINEVEEERKEGFVNFLVTEFSRSITKSELAQGILGWAERYMDGANDGDFESVAKYIDWDTYTKITDEIPALYKAELIPHLKFLSNGEEG